MSMSLPAAAERAIAQGSARNKRTGYPLTTDPATQLPSHHSVLGRYS